MSKKASNRFWAARLAVLVLAGAPLVAAQMLSPSAQPGQAIPPVVITMTAHGPYPKKVQIQQGPFLLAIFTHPAGNADRFSFHQTTAATPAANGGDAASAQATTVSSQPLFEFLPADHRRLDYKHLNLLPGSYELRFSNHPDWTVSITVAKAQ